jgi:hypothetical protein
LHANLRTAAGMGKSVKRQALRREVMIAKEGQWRRATPE